jgi:YkoY family integral membrane protein
METLFTQIAAEAQALGALDLLTIGTLAVLEGILSVDNALVLAILVRTLPKHLQKKALTYGIVGAFVFRFIALIFAAHLMELWVFKLIGGGYLVYLAMKHMFFAFKEDAHRVGPRTAASFWKTVVVVELTDIAFSIDSITTAVAMSDKLLVVWIGGILGIIFLRFAATFFVRLLEKLPRLEDLAYQLIFFIGTKLSLEAFHVEIEHTIFWLMMAIIATLGTALVYRDWHQRAARTRHTDRLLEKLAAGKLTADDLLEQENLPREVVAWLHEQGWLQPPAPERGGPDA